MSDAPQPTIPGLPPIMATPNVPLPDPGPNPEIAQGISTVPALNVVVRRFKDQTPQVIRVTEYLTGKIVDAVVHAFNNVEHGIETLAHVSVRDAEGVLHRVDNLKVVLLNEEG